jgi:histone H3/H4
MASVDPAKAAADMCRLIAVDQGVGITPAASEVMSKMAVEFARLVAIDIAAFAHHRGRKVIGVEDVFLVSRRDRNFLDHLARFEVEILQPKRDAKKAAAVKKSGVGAAAVGDTEF